MREKGRGLKEEEPANPWNEQVVDSYVVQELAFNFLEAEDTSEEVDEREREKYQEVERPEEDESGGGKEAEPPPENVAVVRGVSEDLP